MVDLEAPVAGNQTVSDSRVDSTIGILGLQSPDDGAPPQVLLYAELVGILDEDGVVVVGVQHLNWHFGGGGFGGSAVIRSRHDQIVPILGLPIQVASQIQPAAVGEDAEDVLDVGVVGGVGGDQAVGEAGVVARVRVYGCQLEDLEKKRLAECPDLNSV